MKKTMRILLTMTIIATAMCIALTGCSKESTQQNAIPSPFLENATSQPTSAPAENATSMEPTDEEIAVLLQFRKLYLFMENKNNSSYAFSDDAMHPTVADIYQQVTSLDLSVIDKYRGTEYVTVEYLYRRTKDIAGTEIDWDYESFLSRFTKLENVFLTTHQTVADVLGNSTTQLHGKAAYDAHGNMIHYSSKNNDPALYLNFDKEVRYLLKDYCAQYFYDADRISHTAWYYNGTYKSDNLSFDDNPDEISTYTYNAAGNIIHDVVTDLYGTHPYHELIYAYDENNRLVQISLESRQAGVSDRTITYIYDANGLLLKRESQHYFTSGSKGDLFTTEYHYDENGHLIRAVHTEQDSDRITKTEYTFTCDEQGRILSQTIVFGDTYSAKTGNLYKAATTPSCVITFTYGDYYVYTPAV